MLTDKEINKTLKNSVYDGAFVAVMEGVTSSFITPFAIALNVSIGLISVLSSVPQLLGAFFQLFSVKLSEFYKDRISLLVKLSLAHSVLWLPLILIPYLPGKYAFIIIIVVSLQNIISQTIGPIWNSVMGDAIPINQRGNYFGFRNSVTGIVSFFSAIFAGIILNATSPKNPFLGFSILFAIAFLSRLIASIFKSKMTAPEQTQLIENKFSLLDFVRRMEKTNYGRFVSYISIFKFSVSIASPFFAVYLLKNLNLSYIEFTLITSAEIISSFLMVRIWGKLIDEKGTKSVLYITGMAIPLIPILWLFSSSIKYLFMVQIISGALWAGFNLSASNFIFDAVKPENRVRSISYYHLIEGVFVFLGAILGGLFINYLPAFFFSSTILLVFLISGVLRMATSIIMLPQLKEARFIEIDIGGKTFFEKYLQIVPTQGILFEVIGKTRKTIPRQWTNAKQTIRKYFGVKKEEKDKYNKKLVESLKKTIKRKEGRNSGDSAGMETIQKITEEIEKGKKF